MQYITLDSNNKITAVADHKFLGSILAKEEVVRNEEGQYVFKSDLDEEHEQAIRDQRERDAMQAEFTNAIQQRLDAFAQERGYDNIISACSYFGSNNARFKAEADRAIQLRDDTWAICYAILDAVLAGERAVPTLEEIASELPALTWEDAAEAQPAEELAVTEEPDEAVDPEGADVLTE